MATNHVQQGNIITWTNGTGASVAAGAPVLIGTLVGIALGTIANGAAGEVAIAEVWKVKKTASLAVSQGDALYFDNTNKEFNKTSSGNTLAGRAVAAELAASSTVNILLNV